jgi:hypothetical protein
MPEEITAQMKVSKVIATHPETAAIFRKFGCPDMSHGFFRCRRS